MTHKFPGARSLLRVSFAHVLVLASALSAIAVLAGCGGGSSSAPEAPVLPKAWSPVLVSAVSSTTAPEIFSDGVGGALVVTSSQTNTFVQRFDGVTGAWQAAQTFPLATKALRSASGVTLVGHDDANWWRVDVSASATSALLKVLPYSAPETNSAVVSHAPNGRLLFVDTIMSQDSSFKLRIREIEGLTLVSTALYSDTSPGVRSDFIREFGRRLDAYLVGELPS